MWMWALGSGSDCLRSALAGKGLGDSKRTLIPGVKDAETHL